MYDNTDVGSDDAYFDIETDKNLFLAHFLEKIREYYSTYQDQFEASTDGNVSNVI